MTNKNTTMIAVTTFVSILPTFALAFVRNSHILVSEDKMKDGGNNTCITYNVLYNI